MGNGFVDLFTELFRFLNKIFATPRRKIRQVIAIYDSMNKVIAETAVERFLIKKIHNGGMNISPEGDVFFSVLYEDYRQPFKSVKEEYQKIPLDKEMLKMVLEVIQNKKMVYRFNNMPAGLMKSIYEKEGVNSAVLYFLGGNKKNIYIASCGTSSHIDWTNVPGQQITVDLEINKIKQSIK